MFAWVQAVLKDLRRRRAGLLLAGLVAIQGAFAAPAPEAPDAYFRTAEGMTVSTAELKGEPTLLFLLSTWCTSCSAGVKALYRQADQLEDLRLRVVVLRNYENGGYPGMDIQPYVEQVVSNFVQPENWILGQASEKLDQAYYARHYPDIYFLIDANGRIQDVSSAPAATMDRILTFAIDQQGD
ncbi:redoxin domain-containing protein [Saccharospirillum salsuginis]|uniref:Thioredoxin domain-containing protein n=1 Tax=Saccharospirillum salsuginis TaxID=418750 RepID=A0A918KPE9_9GAMM|nr:redoxin domain-containing protein [Saccharospirillum salsuginis]GGX70806.1 hypothetical protein GCM10007392_42860 [Saccharospirillum salsuginis]